MKKQFNAPYVHFVLKDRLLIATYKAGLQINLEMAKKIVENRKRFTGHAVLPVMILNQGVLSIDKEARDYLSSSEGTKGIKAAAIILHSTFDYVLGSFFVTVNKPRMPVKIFRNKSLGLNWLKNSQFEFFIQH